MVFSDGEHPCFPEAPFLVDCSCSFAACFPVSPYYQRIKPRPCKAECCAFLSLQAFYVLVNLVHFPIPLPDSTPTRHSTHTTHHAPPAWPTRPRPRPPPLLLLLPLPATTEQQSRQPPRPPRLTMNPPIPTIALPTWLWDRRPLQ